MLKKVFSFGLIAILARFSGLIREVAVVFSYGTTIQADVFFIVSSIPLVFFMGYSLIFSNTFIKYYNDDKQIIYSSLVFILIFSLVVSILILFCSELIITILAPGFKEGVKDTAITATKIVSSYIILIGLTNFLGSLLNLWGKPNVTMFSNIVNTIIVVFGIILSDTFGYYSIYIGLTIGYIIQLVFLFLYFLKEKRSNINPNSVKSNKKPILGTLLVIKSSFKLYIGMLIQQLVGVIERAIASGLFIGAVSTLNYAHKINGFLVGILGLLISNILFPTILKKDKKEQIFLFSSFFRKITAPSISLTLFIVCTLNFISITALNYMGINKSWLSVLNVLLLMLCASPFLIVRELLNSYSIIFKMEKLVILTSAANIIMYLLFLFVFGYQNIMSITLAIVLSNILSIILLLLLISKNIGLATEKKIIYYNIFLAILSCMAALGITTNHTNLLILCGITALVLCLYSGRRLVSEH